MKSALERSPPRPPTPREYVLRTANVGLSSHKRPKHPLSSERGQSFFVKKVRFSTATKKSPPAASFKGSRHQRELSCPERGIPDFFSDALSASFLPLPYSALGRSLSLKAGIPWQTIVPYPDTHAPWQNHGGPAPSVGPGPSPQALSNRAFA